MVVGELAPGFNLETDEELVALGIGVNSLQYFWFTNWEVGKHQMHEFRHLDENDEIISAGEISRISGKRVKWACSKGHQWVESVFRRTIYRTGCPYCEAEKKSKNSR